MHSNVLMNIFQQYHMQAQAKFKFKYYASREKANFKSKSAECKGSGKIQKDYTSKEKGKMQHAKVQEKFKKTMPPEKKEKVKCRM